MSEEPSFEEKVRAIFKEVSRSIEEAAENIDLDEVADRIGMSSERFREFAETAGEWLSHQLGEAGHSPYAMFDESREAPSRKPGDDEFEASHDDETRQPPPPQAERSPRPPRAPRRGPHPRDIPTEEQGLALSALDSGRWRVAPGTNELSSDGDGPDPRDQEIVGELRARDWIAASGEVTLVGRDALKRWLAGSE